ncbi:DJ-1/PfpI family protein [Roseivirga sp. BDSF3-8]|uniref:DJ-1/PfpI family protein n=1 Tax=Roseivirga sp. BDSF3-8 TaxID=3241598 RepID=UPI003531E3A1
MRNFVLISLAAVAILFASAYRSLPEGGFYCPPCGLACDDVVYEEAGHCVHCGMELVNMATDEREKQMNNDKITVAFYLQDGVEVLDFAGPLEVFSYAGFEVFIVSKTKDPIISQGVLRVVPDYSLDDAPEADILAFFGGNSGLPTNDPEVIDWVKSRAEGADHLFSVCTGAFILGRAGQLDGLTVTTFHQSIEGLRELVPEADVRADVRFVDNGRVITTAGISAGIDGALHLVAKLRGKEAAVQAAGYMEYDKWVPENGLIIGGADRLKYYNR